MTRTIVVSGTAKMPIDTSAHTIYEMLTIGVSVDVATHTVLGATCSLATKGGQQWLAEQLVGQNLLEEPSPFVSKIQRDYWGYAQNAIIHAYKDLVQRYRRRLFAELQADGSGPLID